MSENEFDGVLVQADKLKWIPDGSGNELKVLRVSSETGAWSALVRAPAGQVNPPHTHLGPADFYVISGVVDYRAGVARAGDWMYEPAGAVHQATSHPEDTVYLANVYGPIAFHDEDGKIVHVLDWRAVEKLAASAG